MSFAIAADEGQEQALAADPPAAAAPKIGGMGGLLSKMKPSKPATEPAAVEQPSAEAVDAAGAELTETGRPTESSQTPVQDSQME